MEMNQKLFRYPLGKITAEGFLADQMKRSKDGMGGHLYELEPGMIRDPYLNKTYVPAWSDGDQSGWGGELSGNYWTGYIQLAYTLNDAEMIAKATEWVDAMLKNQRPDGYLGTYYEEDAAIYDDFNGWGTACMLRGLIAFYEATGRDDVLSAVHRCLLWFCDTWTGEHKTTYAGAQITEPCVLCYAYTGDEKLIAFAEEYAEFLCEHDLFHKSYRSMLTEPFRYYSDHTAGAGTTVRLPALLYAATGKQKYLDATVRRIGQIREHSTQLTGGPVSMTEYFGPVGSVNETEYCSFAYYNATYSCLSAVTGQAQYGDFMEELFYNGAQGARKKDEKAIAYLSAPNQIFATRKSSAACGDMQIYSPCFPVACCPVNSVVLLPEFVRGMLLHDADGNVYAAAYGPCRLNDGAVQLREETLYPFRNAVCFRILSPARFNLFLKLPRWQKGYEITVNGSPMSGAENGDGYVGIGREWAENDCVRITFRAEPEIVTVQDGDSSGKYPLAIRYGALLYALHIPEIWTPVEPTRSGVTPLPAGWSWFSANPQFEEADDPDPHHQLGLRRYQFCWNVALDPALTPSDITVEELPENGYVWENPPIRLHTYAYRAPYLSPVYPEKTFEPFEADQFVTDRLPLTLEPFGCTNLRIAYFPKARRS